MKKYHSLIRFPKEEAVTMLQNCSHMLITEKIDGQNASFKLDLDTNELRTFSRRVEIKEDNHPFRKWALENLDKDLLIPGVIYFGEWLTKHRRQYPEKAYNQFYLFDMYIEPLEEYVNPYQSVETLQLVVDTDGMNVAHVFYDGPPIKDVEKLRSFYTESSFDGKPAEGVVIKDYNYRDRFGSCIMVKLINPEFEESNFKAKKSRNREMSDSEITILQWVNTHITQARLEKTILKLQDEGVLNTGLVIQDMGSVMRVLPKAIIDDAIKEELDELDVPLEEAEVIGHIKKMANRLIGGMARNYITNLEKGVKL